MNNNTCFLLLLLLLSLHCLVVCLATTTKNLTTDQLALLEFKHHIVDPRNPLTSNWTSSTSVCNWIGVSCGVIHERVVALNLPNMNLTGTISPHLGNLSFLQFLDLSANNFYGHLPKQLGQLHLQILNLGVNHLVGQIPSSIFKITSLKEIGLYYNSLSGSLPGDLCHHLPRLEVLKLHRNELSGNIPPSIGKCSNLRILYLAGNKFSRIIPRSIGNLTRLEHLVLGYNNLQGRIPSSIFNISSLKFISLSNNSLSDSLPDDLCHHLLNIEAFSLHDNELYGNIPSSIGECYKLQFLVLSRNQFSGIIPKSLFNSTKLKEQVAGKHLSTLDRQSNPLHFFISDNDLVGEIPSMICNLSSLTVINLSKNKLDGVIPSCLGNLSSLSIVDLTMNQFSGKIPAIYPEGGRLRSLHLNGNQLEGSIPTSLGNCKRLEVLDLGNNNLNGTFPYWLGTLPNLQVLVLRSNQFHGGIQDLNGTFSFSSLRMIDLSRNEFTGLISPTLFDNLKAMREIQENKTGPSYMGETYYYNHDSTLLSNYNDSITVAVKGSELKLERILTVFTVIDFSCNHFQGPIPEAVGELNSLVVLNFSHNSLTGNIPPSVGKLSALESLDLSSNKLQGRIPKQLTELTFLGALNLSQNNLDGPIPVENHIDTFSNDSFVGNSGLCGFPLTKKCGNDVGSESPPSTVAEDEDSETALFWKITAMGYGCGLVAGISMGYMVFTTGRPRWLVKMIKRHPQKRSRTRIHPNGGRRN